MKIMNIFDFLFNKNAEKAKDRFLNKIFYLYPETCNFNGHIFQNYEEYRIYFPVLINCLQNSVLFKDVIAYKNCFSWKKEKCSHYALGINRCLNRFCILDSSFYDPDNESLFNGFFRFRSAVIQMLRILQTHITHYPNFSDSSNIKLNPSNNINVLIMDNLKIIDEIYNKAKISDASLTDSVLESQAELLEKNNSELYTHINPIQTL